MRNRKTLKITTDNRITLVEIDFDDFHSIQKALGGHFETVHTRAMQDYFKQPVIMLVDEEGLFKELQVNMLGCLFYETSRHGHPIMGDVILAVSSGEDILEVPDAEQVMDRLLRDFKFLERSG